ncbi:uncharacterized protein BDW43DRAFT_273795 [Aspergillus alliaceus]|uniref:uncharacterized protein n=1 Tax=Petromyces alliaceus TaxID=209559 RepID=UPI0012A3B761|nr:uncharacterized protein BDW43DRAFT_273795 [Aspergillus alliaceus]KAB8234303.1 hypothetical protein BDW43DRAFT_273795 [Aspergillus alliaceus]
MTLPPMSKLLSLSFTVLKWINHSSPAGLLKWLWMLYSAVGTLGLDRPDPENHPRIPRCFHWVSLSSWISEITPRYNRMTHSWLWVSIFSPSMVRG